jgi:hypothetical protein
VSGSGDFSSDASFGDKLGGRLSDLLSNPTALLSALPLVMGMFQGNQTLPAEKQLQGLATNEQGLSTALEAPLFTGNLPPGAKQAVDQATAADKAGIANTFAKLGLAGSTMEQQAKAGADRRAAAETFQIADSLLGRGVQTQGQAGNIYSDLLRTQMTEDDQFQKALMLFASGLARGGSSYSGAG